MVTLQRGVLEGCDVVINVKSPEDSVMYEPLKSMPDCIEDDVKAKLREQALEIIKTSIIPAFTKLRIFVENVSCIVIHFAARMLFCVMSAWHRARSFKNFFVCGILLGSC